MQTPWALSTLEAVVFCTLVLSLSGAASWVTIIH